jgi:hypothetical protein
VLRAGRDAHWGLPGMRERAEKDGGEAQIMEPCSCWYGG